MRILGPKFVKKANSWCVSMFEHIKGGENQTTQWFSTAEEADMFIKSKKADFETKNNAKTA